VKRATAEQAEQSGDDQIDGNDVVEQPRHDQNEDAGKQRNDRRETEIDVHGKFLPRGGASFGLLKQLQGAFKRFHHAPQ
jgi:hypothetical protein